MGLLLRSIPRDKYSLRGEQSNSSLSCYLLCVLAATLFSFGPLTAQRQVPQLQVYRLNSDDIRLDGVLDEPVWRAAEVASEFIQREPSDGTPATERTSFSILYTSHVIYVGVRAFDSDSSGIRSEFSRRDRSTQSDEIALYIDSYHDRRTAFEFAVTPRGSIRDAYYYDDSRFNTDASWDPVWEVETSIDSSGWSAEFRIPLTQLRFDASNPDWGLQVRRRIVRKAEEVYWSSYAKDASGFVSHFGLLKGLENLSQPLRLEIRPYSAVRERRRPESQGILYAPRRLTNLDGGVDVKLGVTSDFTLDLAANPDFGQVEADPAVVNLSAFESFFPEKRPFFVEGSGLFSLYLPIGQMFYSRRLGRPPQGFAYPPDGGTVEIPEATTILTAAKLTGKSRGGTGLGLMSTLAAEEKATLRRNTGERVDTVIVVEPLTHYFVGRIEQDFLEGGHTVGAMMTAVNRKVLPSIPTLRSEAYVGNIDGTHRWEKNTYVIRWQLAGSNIRGSQTAIIAAQRSSLHYFQRPDARHLSVDSGRTSLSGHLISLKAGKEAGTWQYGFSFYRTSPGFDLSDVGFQWQQAGQQYIEFSGQYLQNRPEWIFRDYRLSIIVEREWTAYGEPMWVWFRPVFFRANFTNNWSVSVNPVAIVWSELSPTALRGGPGLRENNGWNSFVNVTTDRRLPVSLDLWANTGGPIHVDGYWYSLSPSLSVRPSDHLDATVGINYWANRNPSQWVGRFSALGERRYVVAEIHQRTLSLTARVNWILTPRLSVELYAQPYVSSGAYRRFKEVVSPRAKNFAERYRTYQDEIVLAADGRYQVDLNRDGTVDFAIPNPDFSSRQFRSTMVLRWEYLPGSVLFVAWQHGKQMWKPNSSFRGWGDIGETFALAPDNTFLIKMNYWLSF